MPAEERRLRVEREILSAYAVGDEMSRLSSGSGRLEMLRTRELLSRYLPPPPSVIADIGGGPGAYALPLARQGYRVCLVDPVPLHIQQGIAGSKAQPEAPLAGAVIGDARFLEFRDESVDAVLLLGPLYHLTGRDDRISALREVFRVLRPGGIVAAAAISRFASALDGLRHQRFDEPEFEAIVERDLRDGQHRNPTRRPEWFTTAYFHMPEELPDELSEAGLEVQALVAVEGAGWMLANLDDWLDDATRRSKLLDILRQTEAEPSLLGVSAHILTIGVRP